MRDLTGRLCVLVSLLAGGCDRWTPLPDKLAINPSGVEVVEAISLEEYQRRWNDETTSSPQDLDVSFGIDSPTTTYTGPFRIDLLAVGELTVHGAGRLRFRATALSDLNAFGSPSIVIDAVRAADGVNLYDPYATMPTIEEARGPLRLEKSVGLKNLRRQPGQIKSIRGRVSMAIPAERVTIAFDRPASNQCRQGEDWRVVLRNFDSDLGRASFALEGIPVDQITWVAFDQHHRPIADAIHQGSSTTHTISTPNGLSSIQATLVTRLHQVNHAFQFVQIPLAQAASLPKEILPLPPLAQELPVEITVGDGWQDSTPVRFSLQLTNRASKPIKSVQIVLRLRDAEGREIRDSSIQLAGGVDAAGQLARELIPPSATIKSEKVMTDKYEVPPGAAVDAILREVEFADASRWRYIEAPLPQDGAYVTGRVKFDEKCEGTLAAGLCRFDKKGDVQTNICRGTIAPDDSWMVLDSGRAPRSTLLWERGGEVRFAHTRLPPGDYLLWFRTGESICDWKWLFVTDNTRQTIDFSLSAPATGRLEVVLPPGTATNDLRLLPLNPAGELPTSFANVDQPHSQYWAGIKGRTVNGRAAFDRLQTGRYRIFSKDAFLDVSVHQNRTTTCSLADKWDNTKL